jgi:hypothetical protein
MKKHNTDSLDDAFEVLRAAMPDASDEELTTQIIKKFPEIVEQHREALAKEGLDSLFDLYLAHGEDALMEHLEELEKRAQGLRSD